MMSSVLFSPKTSFMRSNVLSEKANPRVHISLFCFLLKQVHGEPDPLCHTQPSDKEETRAYLMSAAVRPVGSPTNGRCLLKLLIVGICPAMKGEGSYV